MVAMEIYKTVIDQRDAYKEALQESLAENRELMLKVAELEKLSDEFRQQIGFKKKFQEPLFIGTGSPPGIECEGKGVPLSESVMDCRGVTDEERDELLAD